MLNLNLSNSHGIFYIGKSGYFASQDQENGVRTTFPGYHEVSQSQCARPDSSLHSTSYSGFSLAELPLSSDQCSHA